MEKLELSIDDIELINILEELQKSKKKIEICDLKIKELYGRLTSLPTINNSLIYDLLKEMIFLKDDFFSENENIEKIHENIEKILNNFEISFKNDINITNLNILLQKTAVNNLSEIATQISDTLKVFTRVFDEFNFLLRGASDDEILTLIKNRKLSENFYIGNNPYNRALLDYKIPVKTPLKNIPNQEGILKEFEITFFDKEVLDSLIKGFIENRKIRFNEYMLTFSEIAKELGYSRITQSLEILIFETLKKLETRITYKYFEDLSNYFTEEELNARGLKSGRITQMTEPFLSYRTAKVLINNGLTQEILIYHFSAFFFDYITKYYNTLAFNRKMKLAIYENDTNISENKIKITSCISFKISQYIHMITKGLKVKTNLNLESILKECGIEKERLEKERNFIEKHLLTLINNNYLTSFKRVYKNKKIIGWSIAINKGLFKSNRVLIGDL